MAVRTLEASDLAKSYGSTVALQSAHFGIDAGEIVALAGENGSGKSTLAKVLAGIVRPDGGSVMVSGRVLEAASIRAARDHGIAYVAQEPAIFPKLSVADNVLMPAVGRRWLQGVKKRDRVRVRHIIESIGLDVDVARPMASLGPAQQVLVELARALVLEPMCLILDEVTTRMPDPQHLFGLVRRLVADGVAAVLITHRFAEISALADRVVVLRNGQNTGELLQGQIDDDKLTELMVGRSVRMFEAKDSSTILDDPVLRVARLHVQGVDTAVDLAVRRGEIVGLGGLMGSGRTELLETIIGARPRKAGEVLVNGAPIPAGNVAATLRAGVGFVPEDRNAQGLIGHAAIATNIALRSRPPLSRVSRREERSLAAGMAGRLSIKAAGMRAPVSSLSGGNAQKVVLGRALCNAPDVLVLDEPTRGVDVRSRAEIYRIVEGMAAGGCGVLMASSDLQELVGLCDRVVVLYDQQVAGQLVGEDITEGNIIRLSSGASLAGRAIPVKE